MKRFTDDLVKYFDNQLGDVLTEIEEAKKISDELDGKIRKGVEEFAQVFKPTEQKAVITE